MTYSKQGTILLVLTPAEARYVVQGLSKLLKTAVDGDDDKKMMDLVYLADYIYERIEEATEYEA